MPIASYEQEKQTAEALHKLAYEIRDLATADVDGSDANISKEAEETIELDPTYVRDFLLFFGRV